MQRDLVGRAMAGDHDAFSELAREDHGLFTLDRIRPDGSDLHAILLASTSVPRNLDWGPAAQP